MRRRAKSWMAGLVLLGLSCDLREPAPLPAVSAAPPPASTRVEGPSASTDSAPVRLQRDDEAIAPLVDFLAHQCTGLSDEETRALANATLEAATDHDLEVRLLMALMHVESRHKPAAVSPVGAIGLMQVLPSTGEEVARGMGLAWNGSETLFDPVANVRIGTAYIRSLRDRYDDTPTALAAYNWGPGEIDRRLREGIAIPVVYPGLVLDAYHRAVVSQDLGPRRRTYCGRTASR